MVKENLLVLSIVGKHTQGASNGIETTAATKQWLNEPTHGNALRDGHSSLCATGWYWCHCIVCGYVTGIQQSSSLFVKRKIEIAISKGWKNSKTCHEPIQPRSAGIYSL